MDEHTIVCCCRGAACQGLLNGNRIGGYYEKAEFINGPDDVVCDSD